MLGENDTYQVGINPYKDLVRFLNEVSALGDVMPNKDGDIPLRYQAGETLSDLMSSTGLSQRQLTKIIQESGMNLRPPGHRRGVPHSDVMRQKLSIAKLGWVPPPITAITRRLLQIARIGRKPSLGMRHTAETRAKMSATRRGALNSRWIDGRKQTPYPSEWTKELRNTIRQEQNSVCLMCNESNHLHIHHINKNKQDCRRENLIGLCYICHGKCHRRSNLGVFEVLCTTLRAGNHIELFTPAIYTRPERISIGDGSRLDSLIKLEGGKGLTIGRFVHIASLAHLNIGGGLLIIGDYAAVASGGKVISGSNQIDALSMSACAPAGLQKVETTVTTLEPYSCVLTNAVMLPGVTLHRGAVLAAGSVATKDIPAWEIWAGVPARFLARRMVQKPVEESR